MKMSKLPLPFCTVVPKVRITNPVGEDTADSNMGDSEEVLVFVTVTEPSAAESSRLKRRRIIGSALLLLSADIVQESA